MIRLQKTAFAAAIAAAVLCSWSIFPVAADSESGGFVMGSGSESGGAAGEWGSGSESGGPAEEWGTGSESGGAAQEWGLRSQSGGAAQEWGLKGQSGGPDDQGAESASGGVTWWGSGSFDK